jgi:hypothetical protein
MTVLMFKTIIYIASATNMMTKVGICAGKGDVQREGFEESGDEELNLLFHVIS